VNGNAQWFQERSLLGRDALRQHKAVLGRHHGIFGKHTVNGRCSTKADLWTQIGMALQAGLAHTTRNRRLYGYQCANLRALSARPKCRHPGRKLMPHLDGSGHDLVTDRALNIVVDV